MCASIQISTSAVDAASSTTKSEVIKLVQGALLIAVAAIAVAGITSVAAPFCVWRGEAALFLNDSFDTAYSVPAITEYASAASRSDWMSLLVAALIAAYPAYHAVWRVREGFGLSCKAPVFSNRVLRFLAAVSACLLLSMPFMGYGTSWLINGSAMGDQSLVETGHHAWSVSILMMLGCALMCLFKWFVAKGPGRNFGSGFAIELVRFSDVLLKRASSNLVLCYVAELLACLLALAFIAVAYVVVSVAIVLAFTAIALVVCLAGLPFILTASWRR
jgi:membrane protein